MDVFKLLDLGVKILDLAGQIVPTILKRMEQEAKAQEEFYGDGSDAVKDADQLVALGEELKKANEKLDVKLGA